MENVGHAEWQNITPTPAEENTIAAIRIMEKQD
jgi:hypothetical protein